jgi:integrase
LESARLPRSFGFGTILCVSPTTAAVASSPKLLDRVRWQLRVKHYSIRTEQAYVDWIRRYILFHRKRHPNLAVEKSVAASTQNQAFSALLFLYVQVLDRKLDFIDNVERVTRPAKLPVVFTPGEARGVIAQLRGDYRLMAELLYGAGLRLMECVRLRVKDIDFGYGHITVRDGKGLRDRVTVLPERLRRPLQVHLARVPRSIGEIWRGGTDASICPLPWSASTKTRIVHGLGSMCFRLQNCRLIRVRANCVAITFRRTTCKRRSR